VAHGAVEAGIRVKANGVALRRNLVIFTQTRSCYQDRRESENADNAASIEVGKIDHKYNKWI